MIAPDKRTAYEPSIAQPLSTRGLDLAAPAREAIGPALIDPLPALRGAAGA